MSLLKNRRFWADIGLFLLAFIAPWWLSFFLALAAAVYFRRFAELVVVGLILDALYAGPVAWFGAFPYALTLIAVALLVVIGYTKTLIRWEAR